MKERGEYFDFIAGLALAIRCNKYLELGVDRGTNLDRVSKNCPYCVGVDILDIRDFKNFIFYQTTTDDFFKKNNETFDMIFIDADHKFESVQEDFTNSIAYLNENGIILLHDTDPIDASYLEPGKCNDAYKVVKWIRDSYPELEIITLPVGDPGLTMVHRKRDRRITKFTTE